MVYGIATLFNVHLYNYAQHYIDSCSAEIMVKSFTMMYSLSFCLFMIHLWILPVNCVVYHIVPSPDHHCPVESCLTLSSFAANASLYLDNNTSLIFQPGNHTMHSQLNVTGIVNFSMISDQSSALGITCENSSKPTGFIFFSVYRIYVSNFKFHRCYRSSFYISNANIFITLTASNLALVKCIFEDIKMYVIKATRSNITIVKNTIKESDRSIGSMPMLSLSYCNVTIVSSTFVDNKGVLLELYTAGNLTIIGCEFQNNVFSELQDFRYNPQGIINTMPNFWHNSHDQLMLLIYDTKFIGNKADIILGTQKSIVDAHNCTFKFNHGFVMNMQDHCKVNIFNSVFNNNKAGTLNLRDSKIQIRDSEFKENVGETAGGAIKCLNDSLISFSGACTLADNQAPQGGAIYFSHFSRCNVTVAHGATVIIINNKASANGGGIYFGNHSDLILHSQSTLQILKNWATANGGGIYLHNYSNLNLHSQSSLQVTLHILENRATNNRGGIYASVRSSINIRYKSQNYSIDQTSNSTIYISRNQAKEGGGLYLELYSKVSVFSCLSNVVNFNKNSADYGGAVNVVTDPYEPNQPIYYDNGHIVIYNDYPYCFFQSCTLQIKNCNISNDAIKCNKQAKPFYFSSNRANDLGFSLYKDKFKQCKSSFTHEIFDEFKLLTDLSNIQATDIGSYLVQLCYCEHRLPNCSKEIPYINTKTGGNLTLDVALVDRRNQTISGSVKSKINSSELVQIRDDQKIQDVINGCTPVL